MPAPQTATQPDYRAKYKVKPGSRVDLRKIDPGDIGTFDPATGKKDARALMDKNLERLNALQELMYAEDSRSLLVILQAMDAAGKDGVISKVFGAMNPQGTKVTSFKKPSEEESAHDPFWRIHRALPPRGHVAIFNRSHYEEVLVVRVKGLVPPEKWQPHFATIDEFWAERYEEINMFEKMLAKNDTHILKFFLHISPEEQLRRFWDRVADPTKHWKISEMDYSERKRWDDYQRAYEDALSNCSTDLAPWFVIPADNKWYARYVISQIAADYLDGIGMKFPPPEIDADKIKRDYFGVNKTGDKPRFDLA